MREGGREVGPDLLFHNNPEPPLFFLFTEGMVLFKHPFHLCWIPAFGRDRRVEVGGARPGGRETKIHNKGDQNKNVNRISPPPRASVRVRRAGGDVTV